MRSAGATRCVWGGTDVEVRRSQQGPTASSRRTRARLGEGLRIELDWLVSLLHPAGAVTEERARAQIKASPARSPGDKGIFDLGARNHNLAPAPFDGRGGVARPRSWRVVTTCALRSCVLAM